MELLTEDQISDGLRRLDGWERDDGADAIRRTVRMPDFMSGIHLVTSVAHAAEEAGHHPDVDIRYNRITFHQTTHAAGGLTAADMQLAARIDELVSAALSHA
ncbi:4a-hydroxytetrahydrobiopterin dehydratase [Streptomonospora wellingtoniae]|uniref:Putative pterin-4-alpha-carbinolamine dehydratase n=1 Tax=Streptomonospora wellingtoniae TaxID=3075544 RepID=A0ABU2KWY3_9ACTN|nr:4a-hydroxytetrahydrobiopterin dehydratase [Streptomonospora sp. DSM 45055]MDT0303794.1 4a-hydroxytetrahydrobiopterin dehydratase [Streptomonospora sp. DSM 45055]